MRPLVDFDTRGLFFNCIISDFSNVIWAKMMLLKLVIDRFKIYVIIYVKMIDGVLFLAYNSV